MEQDYLGFHESIEVHEMLNLKTVNIAKSKMMQGIVFDQNLKALLERYVQQSIMEIGELQNLLNKTPMLQEVEK